MSERSEKASSANVLNPPGSGRRRRWILRGLVSLLVLVIAIAIIGEILFATQIPQDLVLSLVQKQLGLRMSAKSLSTGWGGRTTLEEVTISLPLADRPFLTVGELEIQHTWLPWILISRSISIHKISCDKAEIDLIQDARGNWNIQQAARSVTRGGDSGNSADSDKKPNLPEWPDLQVSNATVVIADNQQRSTNITNLSFDGQSDGPLVWRYQANVPGQLDISGKVAPGGTWSHEVVLALHHAGSWISPWIKSWSDSSRVNVHWVGELDSGRLNARLNVENVEYGQTSVAGAADVTTGNGQVIVSPRGLRINNRGHEAVLDDGQILINGDQLQAEQLAVEFAGGRASIDGMAAFSNGAASVHASWRDIAFPASTSQSGDLSLEFTPTLNEPKFNIALDSQGVFKSGDWNARVILSAWGKDLDSLTVSASAPKLRLETSGNQRIDLSGLALQASAAGNGLYMLREIEMGQKNPIAGEGGYDAHNKIAWLSLDANDWPIPGRHANVLDGDLNLWANSERLHLEQLYVHAGTTAVCVEGDYVYQLPKPVNARIYLTNSPSLGNSESAPLPLGGYMMSEFDLFGTVRPMNLVFSGTAQGSDVFIGNRSVGDLQASVTGTVHGDPKSLIRVDVESQDVELFGGTWTVAGSWPVEDSLLRIDNIGVNGLSLSQLADREDISGTLDGNWSIDVKRFSPDGVTIRGSATVNDLTYLSPSGKPPLPLAEQIQIPEMELDHGDVHLKSMQLIHESSDAGRATAGVWLALADPSRVSLSLEANSWPVETEWFGGASASVSASTKLNVDLKTKSALGHLNVFADIALAQRPVAKIQFNGDLSGRHVRAKQFIIRGLSGGSASGSGSYDLDDPFNTRAELSWKNIHLARLQTIAPNLQNLKGLAFGSIRVYPANTPRPMGPLAVDLHVENRNAEFDNIHFSSLQMFGFIDNDRFVLDDSPDRVSQLEIAGGTVGLWGRLSRPSDDIYESLLQFNLNNLDLNAIVPAGSKTSQTPGLLSGKITMLAQPLSPDLTVGQGELTISNSDLAGTGPIAYLYKLMQVGHDPNKPQGRGTVDFSFQGQTVLISALRYFDRGNEVRASGYLENVLALPHSHLMLTVAGSLRPFSALNLPGFSDFDKALGALQRDALTIRVDGYLDALNDPHAVRAIPFSAIGHDLQNILFGDAKSAQDQSSD
jgi:hypothetical protein